MNTTIDRTIHYHVGDIVKTPIGKNYYTGEHRYYAVPYDYTIWCDIGSKFGEKYLGVILRIDNDNTIVTNPRYRGHAITCFLDKRYKGMIVLSIKITKINKQSMCGEPLEWIEISEPIDTPDPFDEFCHYDGYDVNKTYNDLLDSKNKPTWHNLDETIALNQS